MIDFDDEFAGQGGSYLLDPATGKRTLLERTQETQQTTSQPADPAADQSDASKGE